MRPFTGKLYSVAEDGIPTEADLKLKNWSRTDRLLFFAADLGIWVPGEPIAWQDDATKHKDSEWEGAWDHTWDDITHYILLPDEPCHMVSSVWSEEEAGMDARWPLPVGWSEDAWNAMPPHGKHAYWRLDKDVEVANQKREALTKQCDELKQRIQVLEQQLKESERGLLFSEPEA